MKCMKSFPVNLGDLKKSGYQSKKLKDELRDNLVEAIKLQKNVFKGIYGFDDTVIPDLQRAILSRHNILLLGLRGQAKTKIARLLVNLLDEYIPVIEGSEMNDDPLNPISRYAKDLIEELGDKTPLSWLHRDERYVEKLATPDVTVADLIGDIDPIKAANMKLNFNDERVIHLGLIPRANRCLFIINELPDLQPRIQVSLFNILQEGDIQIRGFKLRMHLDVSFVFTANPEDYTNRGSIVTPLKDRIDSQILTHYPTEIETAMAITRSEAKLSDEQKNMVVVPELLARLIEEIVFQARENEMVDSKSGVSARLSISAYENLVSSAERRALINGETKTTARIGDLWAIVPSITGKIELVYEGEQEGPYNVALTFINEAVKSIFLELFPNPDALRKATDKDPYFALKQWFGSGHNVELLLDESDKSFHEQLDKIQGIDALIKVAGMVDLDKYLVRELILHGLSEMDIVSKTFLDKQFSFKDDLAGMLDDLTSDN